jgi:thymidylate kinase
VGRLICIVGVDGTGKTTQAKTVISNLEELGIKSKYVWLRFYHFFSLPVLLLIRLRGLSSVTVSPSGKKVGYHQLHDHPLLSTLYQMTLFADISMYKLIKIDVPRKVFSTNIVCDRFIYDTIIDLMISTQDEKITNKPPGAFFTRLIPNTAVVFLLSADYDNLIKRRDDIETDINLKKRIELYEKLPTIFKIHKINADDTQINITDQIIKGLHDEQIIQ